MFTMAMPKAVLNRRTLLLRHLAHSEPAFLMKNRVLSCSPPKSPVRPRTPRHAMASSSVRPHLMRMSRHLPLPPTTWDQISDNAKVVCGVLTFFTPASELAACGCCGEKLFGPGCGQQVHALCTQGAKCFRCVWRVCNSLAGDAMRPCKSCKHRVHVACAV